MCMRSSGGADRRCESGDVAPGRVGGELRGSAARLATPLKLSFISRTISFTFALFLA